MTSITVDITACKRDGHCVETCPVMVLTKDAEGYPVTSPEREANCLNCGHCVAVCPTGALHHAKLSADDFLAVQPRQALPDDLDALVRNRRSIRKFKKTTLPNEVLDEIFQVVRYAPTAKNMNHIAWHATRTHDTTRQLAGLAATWLSQSGYVPPAEEIFNAGGDVVLHGAPHVAYCVSPMDDLLPLTDGAIATTTLDLVAAARGVGTCWAGLFMQAANMYSPLRQQLRLPEGHGVVGALMLGYSAEHFHHVPPHVGHADVTWID